MRSRERLIEVLKSVNLYGVGGTAYGACDAAWKALDGNSPHYTRHLFIPNGYASLLKETAANHQSPHVRELATEALFYLEKDSTNG
jgi:hypothetical protein